jgi:hypothetical protein
LRYLQGPEDTSAYYPVKNIITRIKIINLLNEEHRKKRSDGTSGAMREPPRITEEDLRACLQHQYDLSPVTLTFLPVGHDYDAGIYRVESEQGTAYALKVTSRPLYEPRCLVPRYLSDQGIAPVSSTRGSLERVA